MSRVIAAGMIIAALGVLNAQQQGRSSATRSVYLHPSSGDGRTRFLIEALGDRLRSPGKERTVVAGTLTSGSASSNVVLTWELPDKFRLEETNGSRRAFVFDGARLTGRSQQNDADNELLESLTADTAEFFLYQAVGGAPLRYLGERFKQPGATGFGATVDIFEFASPAKYPGAAAVVKQFMFDSDTHLLNRVAYGIRKNGRVVRIRTQIQGWGTVNGSVATLHFLRLLRGARVGKALITRFGPKTVSPQNVRRCNFATHPPRPPQRN
jgi:hypothetical protein